MLTRIFTAATVLVVLMQQSACKQDPINILSTGNFKDTSGPLKAAAAFPIGIGIDYTPFINDAAYRGTVSREAGSVTFGYEMKHGALVREGGAVDFTRADQLFNAATDAGLQVFGHTLCWHQNQNATYLNSVTGGGGSGPEPPSVLANGNFEAGSGGTFTNWSVYNTNGATFSAGAGAEVRGGARSLKIVNPNNNPGNQWRVQIASDLFNTTAGSNYKIAFWIKSTAAGGSGRLSTQPTAQYQGDFTTTTDWTQVTWTITAQDAQTRILFDMGAVANTYLIDDVTVTEATGGEPPTGDALVTAVSNALNDFITKTVTHYKGKVKAWDVVNEPMADGASGLRVRSNSNVPANATDVFFWSDYLGRDFALKAFQYAAAADPEAKLFINDYNLESNPAKLDSLINYVKELKAKGAKIDGIGTQMHISINTSYVGIDNAFRKLAATGLLVRISELDIRANPLDKIGFTLIPTTLAYQANMYKYVIASYLQNVPASQQHGITIWGVTDQDSWIVVNQGKVDAPLLFNSSYAKKPAYAAVLQALRGQ